MVTTDDTNVSVDDLQAVNESAAIVRLPEFCRLRITGSDRAKFLHNFCTNDINGLAVGCVCEAFFTDVKARVVAHGYILAADDHHEIWMLSRDEQPLRNHLERYIITEDVTVDSQTDGRQTFVVVGPDAIKRVRNEEGEGGTEPLTWFAAPNAGETTMLIAEWDGLPVCFLSLPESDAVEEWDRLTLNARPASVAAFESLRIRERFPIIGQDLSSDNLAPEADRDSTAISYIKGCYLGQEPIARIDAMGHVNRKLTRFRIGEPKADLDAAASVSVTSESVAADGRRIGLAMVRLAGIVDGIVAVSVDNEVFAAEVF